MRWTTQAFAKLGYSALESFQTRRTHLVAPTLPLQAGFEDRKAGMKENQIPDAKRAYRFQVIDAILKGRTIASVQEKSPIPSSVAFVQEDMAYYSLRVAHAKQIPIRIAAEHVGLAGDTQWKSDKQTVEGSSVLFDPIDYIALTSWDDLKFTNTWNFENLHSVTLGCHANDEPPATLFHLPLLGEVAGGGNQGMYGEVEAGIKHKLHGI